MESQKGNGRKKFAKMGEEFNQPRQEKIKFAEFGKDHKSSAKYRKRFDQSDY